MVLLASTYDQSKYFKAADLVGEKKLKTLEERNGRYLGASAIHFGKQEFALRRQTARLAAFLAARDAS